MAGMLAARVLADHFTNVIILERDVYPRDPMPRDGVPQARHLHALLPRGHAILEELFPGITADWMEAGADLLDAARDFAWLTPGGWGVRFTSGLHMIAASRPLIDDVVRRSLIARPNVTFLERTAVDGLVTDPCRRNVTGVVARSLDSPKTNTLVADLVVDASGRMSRAPQWLAKLGYEAPPETVINAQIGYASRSFRRDPSSSRNWKAVFIQADPPDRPRAGIAFPVEGDRWIVTLSGGGGDYAPTEEASFLEFARSLPQRHVFDLITSSQPLGPICGYRRTENRRRHYERLNRFPGGFVVMGDAACGFNPVYGQGMSVAALAAMELRRCLAAHRPGTLAKPFHRAQARVCAPAWTLATGEDIRYRNVEGGSAGAADKLMHWYVRHVMQAATHDPGARYTLLTVMALVAYPAALFRPEIVWKVLRQALSGGSHPVPAEPLWADVHRGPHPVLMSVARARASR
jgi:2-polyprenyl-6-methoxyphenol hydroxylase-like FAD-dependent oxidoreductase